MWVPVYSVVAKQEEQEAGGIGTAVVHVWYSVVTNFLCVWCRVRYLVAGFIRVQFLRGFPCVLNGGCDVFVLVFLCLNSAEFQVRL